MNIHHQPPCPLFQNEKKTFVLEETCAFGHRETLLCSAEKRPQIFFASQRTQEPRLHARIILGTVSDRHCRSNFFENSDGHFSWHARHLVSLGYDTCCSANVKNVSFVTRSHRETQYLVSLEKDAWIWRFMCEGRFCAWQAQYLMKFKCHFLWQAQYSVKFGLIAGGCIFQSKRLGSHARIMLRLVAHWE